MTGELFERLLYTDCLPGTGRGAGGGFQVQAQSAGVDSAQSAFATRWLLYEVQVPWLGGKRPVGDFPLGFAHACGAGYGTAQGLYAGKAAAGGRDGNHLTDALLTMDGALYGAVRPAQLWRSALWRESPWPGKDCEPLDAAALEAGPLTADAVAEWARALPEREAVLARLLTLLEDPDGKRAVIVSDGPDEAMTWIAAATLLLPARRALEASFKVFSSIPQRTEHRIAAAPADLFPQLAPGRGGTAFVIDARTGAADDAPVSERAAFYAQRFTADGDPYDVVDAVELADALGGKDQHLGGRDARLTAWALTRPDDELTEPGALLRWLHGASGELLSEHGAGVAALLLEAAPSGEVLRWIDAAVAGGRLDADPAAVRLRLLTAELTAIRGGQQAPVQEVLPPARLDPDAARDAESELSSAILLGSNQQADRLLCLARRHGIVPELAAPLQQRLRDFVSAWIDHPAGYQPGGWVLRTEILDCAHDELRHRAADGGMRSVHEHVRRLNKFFADRADLGDPLDCQIQASLIAAGDRAQRVERLRQLIGLIGQEPASSAGPAAAGLQRALIEWQAADGEVAVIVLTELPASVQVEDVIAVRAAERLDQASRKPTRALLDLLDRLDRQGKAPEADRFARLMQDDRLVRSFIHRAAQDRIATELSLIEDAVRTLVTADPLVVEARLDEVLDACLQSGNPKLGGVVLASLKSPLPRLLVEQWGRTLGQRDPVSDAWWCLGCLLYEDLPDRRHGQLATAIRDYAKSLPPESFDTWYAAVAREAAPHERELWDWLFPKEPPRPRINLWRTRDGGRP